MHKDDGGPAFPQAAMAFKPDAAGGSFVLSELRGGMSLRDWFAGQVLSAVLTIKNCPLDDQTLTRHCYTVADAMLAARKQEATRDAG